MRVATFQGSSSAALLAGLLFASTAHAQIFWAPALGLRGAYELGSEHWQTMSLDGSLAADARVAGAKVRGLARLSADQEDRLEPGRPDDGLRSPANRRIYIGDRAEFSVRELFIDFSTHGRLDWRIGKQQVVWGNGDGIKVLDLVNPQSFREFIAAPPEESRIALWSIFVQAQLSDAMGLDLIVIPDLTLHDIPEPGAAFEITSPVLSPQGAAATPSDLNTIAIALDRLISTPGNDVSEAIGDPLIQALLPLLDPLDSLASPFTPDLLREWLAPRLTFENDAPHLALSTVELGFRWRFRLQSLEGALVGFRHFADVPLIRADISAEEAIVTRSAVQTHTGGLSLSYPFGRQLIRAEGLYTQRAPLPAIDFSNDGLRADAPQVGLLLGIDRFVGDRHFVSVQLAHSSFVKRNDRYPIPPAQQYASVLWRAEWGASGRWSSDSFFIASTTGGGYFLRPRLTYLLDEALTIGLGLDVFSGDRDGVFGQFDARDRLLLQLQWMPS